MSEKASESPSIVRRGVASVSRGDSSVELPYRVDGAASGSTDPLVLCLHGWGMDEDWFARLLQPLFGLPYAFVTPRAPLPIESRSGGSWYDYDGDAGRFHDELARCEAMFLALLSQVETNRGMTPRTRMLLGFSQGGYCGAYVALRHPELFSGLIVSGARIKTEVLEDALPAAARAGVGVLLCHGDRDDRVPVEGAERSRAALVAANVDTHLMTFDAGHSMGRTQLAAIAEWMLQRLGLS